MPTTITGDTGFSQIQAGATSGGLHVFQCRAWVNFNGTRNVDDTGASTNGQPVFIRASGNVTSVIKNGTGDYTVNFTTAMPDANYSAVFGAQLNETADTFRNDVGVRGAAGSVTTTSLRVVSANISTSSNVTLSDYISLNVAIFR